MNQTTATDPRLEEFRMAPTGRNKKLLLFGAVMVVALIVVIFALAHKSVSRAQQAMRDDLRQRQEFTAGSRAELATAWLNSLNEITERIVGADIIKMFAAEVDRYPGDVTLLFSDNVGGEGRSYEEQQLSSSVPLMRAYLYDFVTGNGFSSGSAVNSKGEIYMSTDSQQGPLSPAQLALVKEVVTSGHRRVAPLRQSSEGLMLDMYVPVKAPRFEGVQEKTVAVLIFVRPVAVKITELLSPGPMERSKPLSLVQKVDGLFQEVIPGRFEVNNVKGFSPAGEQGGLPFDKRGSLDGKSTVYSSGARVFAAPWWIVAEDDANLANAAIKQEAKTTYGLAALLAAVLVLVVSTVWWRLVGREQCEVNENFQKLLRVIEDQKKLLDGINSTITDPISLMDANGAFQYVNRAFAQAVGRTPDQVVGLDGQAVFGFDTAKRLNTSDQHVIMTGESVSVNEVIWLQSRRYHFQIAKTPLRDQQSKTTKGIVAVYRDITQLVDAEERSRRVVQQTIDALVRTIEEADPFLGGHSRLMGGFARLMARQLNMSDIDVSTVEVAANLSQTGKMFVPREILLKPGALTQEEKTQMEKHVEYAYNVLKNIEFDLPVVETIMQMNERLDGRGYPNGLKGDEISMPARIVAVANAFTAMARPRSYRPALPVEEVFNILERQTESYDPQVVAALREVVCTPAGERLVEQAASSHSE